MMMKYRLRIAIMTSAIIAVIATAVVGGYAAAQTGSGGPVKLQPPYVARDSSGDPVLTVRLQMGVLNTGRFFFTVGKIGVWGGVIGVQPTGHSPVVHLRGEVDAHFTPNGSDHPVPARVRMEGTINTAHNSATINVWTTRPGISGQSHYLINTNPAPKPKKAAAAAETAAALLQAQNWAKLYGMAADAITSSYTKAQFVKLLEGQPATKVHDIAPSGAGASSESAGSTYFTQEFTFSTVAHGKTSRHTAEIIMIWENKAWRFAGTTAPTA